MSQVYHLPRNANEASQMTLESEARMELAHANRVATIGELAASIVHEVNQPIAATVTNAQAALRWLDGEPPVLEEVRRALARIVKDADRASEVVNCVRALAKKAPTRKDCIEINDAIREAIELTRGQAMEHGISVRSDLADGLPLIEGDWVQLQQVVLNLIVNAIQAMGAVVDGAREVRITTGQAEPNGVVVAVRDSGLGLAPASREHLFEPFYTTKPDGLGMGLSICRSIIEAHGGRLWAEANEPRGAIFRFSVPAHRAC